MLLNSTSADVADPAGWFRDAVAYQIFVDRFANGDPGLDPVNVVPWGSQPSKTGFMGGDLRGITNRLDYLVGLGVNLILLTPIFISSSNHRYNTYDYYKIDPRLGTIEDLRRLIGEAHRRGMRVLFDGVFNHCGRGFFPFFDVMENGAASEWREWFYINGFPVEAYGTHRFLAWQNTPALPEFNLANRCVREYLLRVVEFWTREGIDGWRLDAVLHVRHGEFWRELRELVLHINPAAYLLAEIWEDPKLWLDAGYFDGATNYQFRELVLKFVLEESISASDFAGRLDELVTRQPWPIALGMCNLVGSHDTPRIRTLARGNRARVKLALLLQFFFPGIPAIYYGDEIGLEGGQDPDNRRAMEWDPTRWDQDLRLFVRELTACRHTLRPLRSGAWQTIIADDHKRLCVFMRHCGAEIALLVIGNGEREESISLDCRAFDFAGADQFVDRLSGKVLATEDGALRIDRLPPHSGALLVSMAAERHATLVNGDGDGGAVGDDLTGEERTPGLSSVGNLLSRVVRG